MPVKYLSKCSGPQEWHSPRRSTRYVLYWWLDNHSLTSCKGYRDINLVRVRKAERYLLRCHEVFIVANMNRVVSDRSVAKVVKVQMKASGKRTSITIVCTHADVRHVYFLSWQIY